MLKKTKVKIITNGDNSLKKSVREELTLIAAKDSNLRKRLRYLVAVHSEKVTARDVIVNKEA